MSPKTFIICGTILGGIAVAFGAVGTHMIEPFLAERDGNLDRLDSWKIGVRYQMYHALAMIALGGITMLRPSWCSSAAGWLFVMGVLFFSGSIYLLVLTTVREFGMLAAFGGSILIIGWLFAIFGAFKMPAIENRPDYAK